MHQTYILFRIKMEKNMCLSNIYDYYLYFIIIYIVLITIIILIFSKYLHIYIFFNLFLSINNLESLFS